MVRRRSAKPLFIGSIPIAASRTVRALCRLLLLATVSGSLWGPPARAARLYGDLTPPFEIVTLPVPSGGFVSFRAQRLDVTLWGQPLAVLAYSGPLASGQSEFSDGRYSLITIPRNPSEEIIFLRSEVWPVIGSPSLTAGGFRNLAPETVLPPDDPRLDRLEANLLRAAWYPVALDLGLIGDAMPRRNQAWRQTSFRRLQERVITGEERNGFLHESQHALDEAHKVYPELYRDPTRDDRAAAELRAALAALAHSGDPHYELYQSVRQYRQRLEPYAAAVAEMFSLMAESILAGPVDHYGGLKPDKNVMLQLPRISAEDLRRLAARVMAGRFSEIDRQAGYHLDYDAHELSARELQVGTLRGEIRPEDLPPPAEEVLPGDPLASWDITGRQVEAVGFHIYLAGRGVQVAQADEYGLAIGPGGYLAAHVRVAPGQGPWRLEISGGLFKAGETAGERTGLEVLAGLERMESPRPQPGGGRFVVSIPAEAAEGEILRVVLARGAGKGPPAFLRGIRLYDSSSERVNSDTSR